jgi:hypothetical protein
MIFKPYFNLSSNPNTTNATGLVLEVEKAERGREAKMRILKFF